MQLAYILTYIIHIISKVASMEDSGDFAPLCILLYVTEHLGVLIPHVTVHCKHGTPGGTTLHRRECEETAPS